MNTFTNAVINQNARTENGMNALLNTNDACTDLFYKIGAMRGQDVIPAFVAAYVQNPDIATRIALWARDIRGGAGERKAFRDILNYLAKNDPDRAQAVMNRVPDLGRWDDLLAIAEPTVRKNGFEMIRNALAKNDGLVAKWMPRQGEVAAELRKYFNITPKQWRKTLVNLTKVVETQMCAKNWDEINFNHVPSLASSRYKKAFARHTEKYKEWATKLASGDKTVKVNASAVYPYDVLKGLITGSSSYNKSNLDHIVAQWEALPNYVGEANILPLVDVSGSMFSGYTGKNSTFTPLEIAVSLGLYLADKNKGKFKDTFLTFSSSPELLHLKGNILEKISQMSTSKWEMSTNLHAAFEKILATAKRGKVAQDEMPSAVLILSDMQFDHCVRFDDSAIEMIRRKYEDAGYKVPKVVFWNLKSRDNVPVSFNEKGAALVSGFSPSIVKSVLQFDIDGIDAEQFTPFAVMMQTLSNERYNY